MDLLPMFKRTDSCTSTYTASEGELIQLQIFHHQVSEHIQRFHWLPMANISRDDSIP
uniref:Uncharacterized protein n=1 Tax=Arundo donax TaxID=35708 RepID=A0A0A9FHF9_ARUDO